MKKLNFLIFSLILILGFSSAIKISPSQQKIFINSPNSTCAEIWVLPEGKYNVHTRWAFDGRGDVSKYSLTREQVGVEYNYSYSPGGKHTFCFSGKRNGKISGIIYFYLESEMVEIGSWIDLEVSGNSISDKISIATGRIIKEVKKSGGPNIILLSVFITLVMILIMVLFIGKRRPEES